MNDRQAIEEIDTSDLLSVVEDLGAQCEDGAAVARAFIQDTITGIGNIVILGMGGSGISGDIARTLLASELSVPLDVVKGYSLPGYVGGDTLVFAVSYSGETEETLSCYKQAAKKGARIIAITSGGELRRMASDAGHPVIGIPGGLQPRAALGYLLMPVIVILSRLEMIPDISSSIEEAVSVLKEMHREFSFENLEDANLPKRLARMLFGKIPVVYGSEGVLSAAALRWKCQFNENSKIPAFQNVFPELNHNEIVGWELMKDRTRSFHLIMLRSADEHDRIQKRIDITLPLIADHLDGVTEIWARGDSRLAQLLSTVYIGDLTSVYLAILNGVNPTPVDRIKLLKKKLS